jgi:hypothetical protein
MSGFWLLKNDLAPLSFLRLLAEPKSLELEMAGLLPHHFIAFALPSLQLDGSLRLLLAPSLAPRIFNARNCTKISEK